MKRNYFIILILIFCSTYLFADTLRGGSGYSKRSGDTPIKQKLMIVGPRTFDPYSFVNSKGVPDGFCINIFEAIAKHYKWNYQIVMCESLQCQKLLDEGKADLIVGIDTEFDEEKPYIYSQAVNTINVRAVTKNGVKFRNLQDLSGKTVIVKSINNLVAMLNSKGIYPKPIYVSNMEDGINLLAHGNNTMALCDNNVAKYYIVKNNYYDLTIHSPNIYTVDMQFLARDDNKALIDSINAGILHLRASGEYDRIYNKWFGVLPPKMPFMSQEGYVILCCVVVVLLILSIFVQLYKRKLRVAKRQLEELYKKDAVELRKMNAVLDALPLGVAMYDKDGRQRYINKSVAETYGIDNYEMHKAHKISLFEDPQLSDEYIEKARNGEDFDVSMPYDLSLVEKNQYFHTSFPNKQMYIDAKVRFVRDENGNIENIIMVLNDITENHKLSSDLHLSQQQLNIAMNVGNLRVWEYIVAEDHIHVLYRDNDPYEGCTLEKFKESVLPEDLPGITELFSGLLNGNLDQCSVCIRIFDNGKNCYRYYNNDFLSFKDSDGNVTKIIGTSHDVTDEKIHDEELMNINKTLELVIANAKVDVWQYDIDMHTFRKFQNGRFEDNNKGHTELAYLVAQEDRHKFREAGIALLSGMKKKLLIDYKEKDENNPSSYRYKECLLCENKDNEGKLLSIIAICSDVTSRQEIIEHQQGKIKSLDLAMSTGNIYAWYYNVHDKEYNVIYGESVHDGDFMSESVINPDDKAEYESFLRRCSENKSNHKESTIIRFWSKSLNKYLFFELSAQAQMDKEDKPIGVIGVSKDVTSLYELQIKIKERVKLIETIYANLSVGIVYYDSDAILREVNDASLTMMQSIARKDAVGKINLFDELSEKHKDLLDGLKSGQDMHYRGSFNKYGLKNKIYDIHFIIVRDENGTPLGYVQINSDITDMIKEKEVVEKLKLQYETMFNSLYIGVVIRDTMGTILQFNKSYSKILGINDEEWYLKNKAKLSASDNIPIEVREALSKKLVSEYTIEYDFDNIKDKDYYDTSLTGVRYLSIKISPMIDSRGVTVGTLDLISDVTSEVNSQRLIEEEQLRSELAIKASKIVPWEYDINTKELSIKNYKFAPEGKATMETFYPMIADEDKEKVKDMWRHMELGLDKVYSTEVKYKTPGSDEWSYGTIEAQPFEFDKDGKCIRYAGYRRDNTSMVKLNQEVREYGERLKYILRHSKIYTWDYYPKETLLRMTSQKESASKDMVITPDDKYFNGIYFEDRDHIRSIYQRMNNLEKNDYRMIIRRKYKGSSMRYLEINGMAIRDEHGDVSKYSGLCKDITEMMEVQKNLEDQREKALQADRLKSAFLANMSHEIRTPLNAIIGFSELLQDTEDMAEREEFMKIINTNNQLLLQLINDILDLSKIEAGVMDFHNEVFKISQFLDGLCKSLEQRLENPNVKLIKEYAQSDLSINIDKMRLTQVIMNFGVNAIKYTSNGFVKFGYELQKEWLYVYVADSGAGIAKNDIHKLFARFEKLGSFVQGTGLGLAISKAIINALGGKIGCDSKKGEGSIFWIKLPLKYIVTELPN